jgi:hypothetical protein
VIVLKEFKTVNQVFKIGDEIYENIEGLEHWVTREFVGLETFVEPTVVVTPVAPANTQVPSAATFA